VEKPRTVFLGTPAFAIPALQAIEGLGWPVVGVYAGPDRPAGRGRAIATSPVKQYALERGLDVRTPENARGPTVVDELLELAPDLILLAAYGKLLPKEFLAAAPLGALNLHPSLLPRHRGAIPVQATILAGDKQAGTTIIAMDEGLDTGPIVAQAEVPLRGNERAPELTERLFVLGAELIAEHALAYVCGDLRPMPQGAGDPPLRRLTKETGALDWAKSAAALERQVRAYDPWPGAYTTIDGAKLEVVDASVIDERYAEPIGTVVAMADGVGVVTATGVLFLRRVKLAGRTEADITDFLRGHPGLTGTRLPS